MEALKSKDVGITIEDILIDLERISDHCSNVAISVIETMENVYETHSYIDTLPKNEDSVFVTIYNGYSEEYHLPEYVSQ